MEVLCPQCAAHLLLPVDLSGKTPVKAKTVHALPSVPHVEPHKVESPKNIPLTKSGHALAAPAPASPAEESHAARTSLPPRRKPPEERQLPVTPADNQPELESATLPRAVLPEKRAVEDYEAADHQAGGRARKQAGQLPPAKEPAPAHGDPVKKREPIPARGDVEIQAPVRKAPEPPTPEPAARAAATEAPAATSGAGDAPREKKYRIGAARQAAFSPLHEADLSAENTGQWGGDGPAEQVSSHRRTYSIGLVLLVLGILGISGYFLNKYFNPETLDVGKTGTSTDVETDLKRIKKISSNLTKFFKADTPEALTSLSYLRLGTGERIRNYYKTTPLTPRQVVVSENTPAPVKIGSGSYVLVTVKIDGYLKRSIPVFENEKGEQLVDWEYYVSWAPLPWTDFLKTGSENAGEYRVRLNPDPAKGYYNFAYSDRFKWLSFELMDPMNEQKCYAYCTLEEPAGRSINAAIRKARERTGSEVTDLILRLKFEPEGQKTNQVRIIGFVQEGWIQP